MDENDQKDENDQNDENDGENHRMKIIVGVTIIVIIAIIFFLLMFYLFFSGSDSQEDPGDDPGDNTESGPDCENNSNVGTCDDKCDCDCNIGVVISTFQDFDVNSGDSFTWGYTPTNQFCKYNTNNFNIASPQTDNVVKITTKESGTVKLCTKLVFNDSTSKKSRVGVYYEDQLKLTISPCDSGVDLTITFDVDSDKEIYFSNIGDYSVNILANSYWYMEYQWDIPVSPLDGYCFGGFYPEDDCNCSSGVQVNYNLANDYTLGRVSPEFIFGWGYNENNNIPCNFSEDFDMIYDAGRLKEIVCKRNGYVKSLCNIIFDENSPSKSINLNLRRISGSTVEVLRSESITGTETLIYAVKNGDELLWVNDNNTDIIIGAGTMWYFKYNDPNDPDNPVEPPCVASTLTDSCTMCNFNSVPCSCTEGAAIKAFDNFETSNYLDWGYTSTSVYCDYKGTDFYIKPLGSLDTTGIQIECKRKGNIKICTALYFVEDTDQTAEIKVCYGSNSNPYIDDEALLITPCDSGTNLTTTITVVADNRIYFFNKSGFNVGFTKDSYWYIKYV